MEERESIVDILAKVYINTRLTETTRLTKWLESPLAGAVLTQSDLNREMVR